MSSLLNIETSFTPRTNSSIENKSLRSIYTLDSLTKNNKKYKRALKLAIKKINELEEKNKDASCNSPSHFTREIEKWKVRVRQAEKGREEAEQLARNLAEEIKEFRCQLLDQPNNEENDRCKLDRLTRNLNKTSIDVEERTRSLTASLARVQELEEEVSRLNESMLLNKVELRDYEERYQESQLSEKAKDKQIEELSEKCYTLSEKLNTELDMAAELQHNYGICKNQYSILEEELVNSKKVSEEQRKSVIKIEELTDKLRQMKEQYDIMTNLSKNRIKKRDRKIYDLKEKLESLHKERCFLIDEVKSLAKATHCQENFHATVNEVGQISIDKCPENKDNPSGTNFNLIQTLQDNLKKEQDEKKDLLKEFLALKHDLILLEEKRKTDLLRQVQLMKGKEQESDYVWQKYLQAMQSHSDKKQ